MVIIIELLLVLGLALLRVTPAGGVRWEAVAAAAALAQPFVLVLSAST